MSCLDVTLRVLRRLDLAASVGASFDAHTARTVTKMQTSETKDRHIFEIA